MKETIHVANCGAKYYCLLCVGAVEPYMHNPSVRNRTFV